MLNGTPLLSFNKPTEGNISLIKHKIIELIYPMPMNYYDYNRLFYQ